MKKSTLLLFGLLFFSTALLAAEEDYVWWEGENPQNTNFPSKTWFSSHTFPDRASQLSEGKWLTHIDKRKGNEPFARYKIRIPKSKKYNFWTRKFWKHGPFRWRFDKGPWQICSREVPLADSVALKKFVSVNWVFLGKVSLPKGPHTFELRLLAKEGENQTCGFDCFLLTPRIFVPRGKLKPQARSGAAPKGHWAFEPSPDPFKKALLNLRDLNEKEAGERGFVVSRKGKFYTGAGKPLRFWGVNCGVEILKNPRDNLSYLAKSLAKRGVNLVRFHGPLYFTSGRKASEIDPEILKRLHIFVYLLKKEGIYLSLSFYFPLWFPILDSYSIPGYSQKGNPFGLLFFHPEMQKIYKGWAKKILTTKNPYTGKSLSKESALAFVEIQNEDSLLFWTFSKKALPQPQWEKLEGEFSKGLIKKYGSCEKALQSWGSGARQGDDRPSQNKIALLEAWHMTKKGHGTGGKKRRMTDQLEFLVETQRDFYKKMISYLHRDLGAKSLISCSNWKTADPALLAPLERYTYTAGQIIDRHGYFGGPHKGQRASYAVSPGDTFSHRSGLLEPQALPLLFVQNKGFPHILSEIGWTNPNRFKAEFPFLCAAYGSLQDLDGFCFFAIHSYFWEGSMTKFPLSIPSILGQFPGLALLYRRGDLKEGPGVAEERLSLKDLFDFQGSFFAEKSNLDALRKTGDSSEERDASNPESLGFYIGKVERSYSSKSKKILHKNLKRYLSEKEIKSATGEIRWDYKKGVLRIDCPEAQGACGFLSRAGKIKLSSIEIQCNNEYASILVISLDGKKLSRSKKILVQMVTEGKFSGWEEEAGKILNLGGYPLTLPENRATLQIKNSGISKIKILDENGYLKKSKDLPSGKITLPKDSFYLILE